MASGLLALVAESVPDPSRSGAVVTLRVPSAFTTTSATVPGVEADSVVVVVVEPALTCTVTPRGTELVNIIATCPFGSNAPLPTTDPFRLTETGVPARLWIARPLESVDVPE